MQNELQQVYYSLKRCLPQSQSQKVTTLIFFTGVLYKNMVSDGLSHRQIWKNIFYIFSQKDYWSKFGKQTFLFFIFLSVFNILRRKYAKHQKTQKFDKMKADAQVYSKNARNNLLSIQLPQFNNDLVQKVLESDVQQLKEMIFSKKVTSVQLLQIFTQQSQVKGINLELVTQDNYTQALEMAKICDQRIEEESIEDLKKLPLFGVPVSIKDCFEVKGLYATGGLINNLKKPSQGNGKIVQLLINAGAVPFIKTNVPQMMMTIESYNYIWGRAQNPWDNKRTSGGSSGGESGLIAARCSPLGLGTDIGSSVRQPCAYCGLAGLKPSSDRLTNQGKLGMPFIELYQISHLIKTCPGPMGKSTQDCALMMEALLSQEINDSLNSQIYEKEYLKEYKWFNHEAYNKQYKKLKIGYFKSIDGIFPACQANQRGVQETVNVLRKLGHEVELTAIPNIEELIYQFIIMLGPDGLFQMNKMKKHEPIISEYNVALQQKKKRKVTQDNLQNHEFPIYTDILKTISKGGNTLAWDSHSEMSAAQYKHLSFQLMKTKNEFYKWYNQNNYDALIFPVTALPAISHQQSQNLVCTVMYCWIANLLDIPAGTIPVTVVRENEQNVSNNYSEKIQADVEQCMKGSAGLPVGIQIMSVNNQEEKILNIMNIIEKEVKFHEQYQPNPNIGTKKM